jgi:hypothetical protein
MYELNNKKAVKLAILQHPLSDIENIVLSSRDKIKNGNNIIVKDVYDVRMRGKLIGTNIFKLKVYVSGNIAMDDKVIQVLDGAYVEE